MFKKNEMLWVFGFGAVIYGLIEVLYRGYTHWTMTIAGGIAFSLIYLTNTKIKSESLIIRCIAGTVIITAVEFAAGLLVNVILHMNVWNYSDEKFNVLGQICPLFSFAWFFVCIPATFFSFLFRERFTRNKSAEIV